MNTTHFKSKKTNYIGQVYNGGHSFSKTGKLSKEFLKQWDNFDLCNKPLGKREIVYQKNIKEDITLPEDKEAYYSENLLKAFAREDIAWALTYSWDLYKKGKIDSMEHKLTCMRIIPEQLEGLLNKDNKKSDYFNSKPLEDLLEWFATHDWNKQDQELFTDKKILLLAMISQTGLVDMEVDKLLSTLEQSIYSLSINNPESGMLGVSLFDFAIKIYGLEKSEAYVKQRDDIHINLIDVWDVKERDLGVLKECVFSCKNVSGMIEKLKDSVDNNDRLAKEHRKILDIAQAYYQTNKSSLSEEERKVAEKQLKDMAQRVQETWYLLDVLIESSTFINVIEEYYQKNKHSLSLEKQIEAEKQLEEMTKVHHEILKLRDQGLKELYKMKFN